MYGIKTTSGQWLKDTRTNQTMTFTFEIDGQIELDAITRLGHPSTVGAKVLPYTQDQEN